MSFIVKGSFTYFFLDILQFVVDSVISETINSEDINAEEETEETEETKE